MTREEYITAHNNWKKMEPLPPNGFSIGDFFKADVRELYTIQVYSSKTQISPKDAINLARWILATEGKLHDNIQSNSEP